MVSDYLDNNFDITTGTAVPSAEKAFAHNPTISLTGVGMAEIPINEVGAMPSITGVEQNEIIPTTSETEASYTYLQPKKVIVKRYKLKK